MSLTPEMMTKEQLWDTIEALRGENARLTEERDSAQRVGIQTMRERDEARADEELMSKAKQACEAENARLKGALAVIASDPTHSGQAMIARKALGETT